MSSAAGSHVARRLSVALMASATVLVFPALAQAGNQIYWGEPTGGISYSELDGSVGQAAVTHSGPGPARGIALDPSTNRIYFSTSNQDLFTISYVGFDGAGAGSLNTGAATLNDPVGVAIDRRADRRGATIYWANFAANKISYASLDGSGGGDLNTGSATVNGPWGVAIDPALGRIYWTNAGRQSTRGGGPVDKISYANFDGSGGADLTTSAPIDGPEGIAIDAPAGRIYWSNAGTQLGGGGIASANLDGSGGGTLNTFGASPQNPDGLAIDPAAGRIYFANAATYISYAKLDGSGGGQATFETDSPYFVALLEPPIGAGLPAITGGFKLGSTLSCSQGAWTGDLTESFLFRTPTTYQYQWSDNGNDIAGATQSTYTTTKFLGTFRCRVTAVNAAGQASQTSLVHSVLTVPPPPVLKPVHNFKTGNVKLIVSVPLPGTLTLAGKGVVPVRKLRAAKVVHHPGNVGLVVKAKGRKKKTLRRTGKVKATVAITYTPTGGKPSVQRKTVSLKLK